MIQKMKPLPSKILFDKGNKKTKHKSYTNHSKSPRTHGVISGRREKTERKNKKNKTRGKCKQSEKVDTMKSTIQLNHHESATNIHINNECNVSHAHVLVIVQSVRFVLTIA